MLLSALKTLAKRPPATIGQITAFNILKGCTSDAQAFARVKEAYTEHYGDIEFEFETWRGDIVTMTAGKMLLEQARLLWMLRTWDDDVIHFFGEI